MQGHPLFRDLIHRSQDPRGPQRKPELPKTRREVFDGIAARVASALTEKQGPVLTDPADKVSVLVGRRGGKTFSFASILFYTCLIHDDAVCYFGAKTRVDAKRIIWRELQKFNRRYGLGCEFLKTDVVVNFPNGSFISLVGLEKEEDCDRLRGVPIHVFIVDETDNLNPRVLSYLEREVVDPSLDDYGGKMIIGGTPGCVMEGPFFEATAPEKHRQRLLQKGEDISDVVFAKPAEKAVANDNFTWSLHRWSVKDNTKMPHIWQKQLARKKRYGWSDDNPIWRREYLGEWVEDTQGLVYPVDHERNIWVPNRRDPKCNKWGLSLDLEPWHYLLGFDMGYDDPFAIVVGAYSDHSPDLFQVYEFKQSEMTTDACRQKILHVDELFGGVETMVGDRAGMSKAILETWAENYDDPIHAEAAQKKDKRNYIELHNSDLHEGRIKIIKDGDLAAEMSNLQWNREHKGYARGNYVVGRTQDDHLCDAWLYIWRYAFHHLWEEKRTGNGAKREAGDVRYWKEREEEWKRKAVARANAAADADWWDDGMNENRDAVAYDEPWQIQDVANW